MWAVGQSLAKSSALNKSYRQFKRGRGRGFDSWPRLTINHLLSQKVFLDPPPLRTFLQLAIGCIGFQAVGWSCIILLRGALAEDAITHGGPGRMDRFDMNAVCMHRKAPGISLIDATKTQALTAWALKNILTFTPKPWRGGTGSPFLCCFGKENLRTGRCCHSSKRASSCQ